MKKNQENINNFAAALAKSDKKWSGVWIMGVKLRMTGTIDEGRAGEESEYDDALRISEHCEYSTVPSRLRWEKASRG